MAVVSILSYGVSVNSGIDQTTSINAAIAQAVIDGVNLLFPDGSYLINGNIIIENGVSLSGDPAGLSRLYTNGSNAVEITNGGWGGNTINDMEISGLVLDNVVINLSQNSTAASVTNNIIYNSNAELQIVTNYGSYTIADNILLRDTPYNDGGGVLTSNGRGISIYETNNTTIEGNIIGGLTEHALETQLYTSELASRLSLFKVANPSIDLYDSGFYTTAINGSSGNSDIIISENIIAGSDSNAFLRDHAIYIGGFDGLQVNSNYFSGWYNDATGGVKIRNGNDTYIHNNFFDEISLITYTYDNLLPTGLTDTFIFNNSFHNSSDGTLLGEKGPIYYTELNNLNAADPILIVSNYNIYNNTIDALYLNSIELNLDIQPGEVIDTEVHIASNFDMTNGVTEVSSSQPILADNTISLSTLTIMDTMSIQSLKVEIDGLPSFSNVNESINYTEGEGAILLGSAVHISDSTYDTLNNGLGDYDGATLSLSRFNIHSGPSANDEFSFGEMVNASVVGNTLIAGGKVIASFTMLNGILDLVFISSNGAIVTTALANEIFSSISYQNLDSSQPVGSNEDITVVYTFSDGSDSVHAAIKLSLIGADSDDLIEGTTGNDIIDAGIGNDLIRGHEGDDNLKGGSGDDVIFGHDGADHIIAGDGNDYVDAGAENDFIYGGEGDDDLRGGDDDDFIFGEEGNDKLTGGTGINEIHGGMGDDTIYGGTGLDTIFGDDGLDNIRAGDGDDVIYGGKGNDVLRGESGNDNIKAGDGNDFVDGGEGSDVLEGGAGLDKVIGSNGSDTASYASSATGVNVDLLNHTASGGDAAGDILSSIENLTGSAFADNLKGDNDSNRIDGGNGNDNLVGFGGNDILLGQGGSDFLYGNSGIDTASYTGSLASVSIDLLNNTATGGDANGDTLSSIENLFGSSLNDDLRGDNGANRIEGADGNDFLSGRNGSDTIYGGNGADQLYGGEGNDQLFGGEGNDRLTGNEGNDVLSGNGGHDNIFGRDGNDRLYGGDGNDRILGDAGDDYLVGNAGNDLLIGGIGNDNLQGREGDDRIFGGDGNDELRGFEGKDYLVGNDGDDLIAGFDGHDSLHGRNGEDRMYGNNGNDYMKGGAGKDFMVGNAGNDALYGEADNDKLYGRGGNDRLYGGGGNDYMKGGDGDDILDGGDKFDSMYGEAGDDTFVFSSNWRHDRVMDWDEGEKMDMSSLGLKDIGETDADVFAKLTVEQVELNTVINITNDDQNSIILIGIDSESIDVDDFLF